MSPFEYSFAAFRTDIIQSVRILNAGVADAAARWSGVLFLDAPEGLQAERF